MSDFGYFAFGLGLLAVHLAVMAAVLFWGCRDARLANVLGV